MKSATLFLVAMVTAIVIIDCNQYQAQAQGIQHVGNNAISLFRSMFKRQQQRKRVANNVSRDFKQRPPRPQRSRGQFGPRKPRPLPVLRQPPLRNQRQGPFRKHVRPARGTPRPPPGLRQAPAPQNGRPPPPSAPAPAPPTPQSASTYAPIVITPTTPTTAPVSSKKYSFKFVTSEASSQPQVEENVVESRPDESFNSVVSSNTFFKSSIFKDSSTTTEASVTDGIPSGIFYFRPVGDDGQQGQGQGQVRAGLDSPALPSSSAPSFALEELPVDDAPAADSNVPILVEEDIFFQQGDEPMDQVTVDPDDDPFFDQGDYDEVNDEAFFDQGEVVEDAEDGFGEVVEDASFDAPNADDAFAPDNDSPAPRENIFFGTAVESDNLEPSSAPNPGSNTIYYKPLPDAEQSGPDDEAPAYQSSYQVLPLQPQEVAFETQGTSSEPLEPVVSNNDGGVDPYHWRNLPAPPKSNSQVSNPFVKYPTPALVEDAPKSTPPPAPAVAPLDTQSNGDSSYNSQPFYYKPFEASGPVEATPSSPVTEAPSGFYYKPQDDADNADDHAQEPTKEASDEPQRQSYEFGFPEGEFKIPDFFRNFLSAPPAWIKIGKNWRRR